MNIFLMLKEKRVIFYVQLSIFMSFASYFYFSPHISLIRFKAALDSNDVVTANSYIDFPSVKKSLKSQLHKGLNLKFKDRFSRIGLKLLEPVSKVFTDAIIEFTVTPSGINTLISEGKFSKTKVQIKNENQKLNNEGLLRSSSISIKDQKTSEISLNYININTFLIMTSLDNLDQPIKSYLTRKNFLKWKLTSVDLPSDLIDRIIKLH